VDRGAASRVHQAAQLSWVFRTARGSALWYWGLRCWCCGESRAGSCSSRRRRREREPPTDLPAEKQDVGKTLKATVNRNVDVITGSLKFLAYVVVFFFRRKKRLSDYNQDFHIPTYKACLALISSTSTSDMFESPNVSEMRATIQRLCDQANNNAGVYVYGTALWRLTDLGLLHARLYLHLGYDLVHVGLQHHAPHHHLLQDVMDLQTDATQRLTHSDSVTGTSLLACRLRLNIQSTVLNATEHFEWSACSAFHNPAPKQSPAHSGFSHTKRGRRRHKTNEWCRAQSSLERRTRGSRTVYISLSRTEPWVPVGREYFGEHETVFWCRTALKLRMINYSYHAWNRFMINKVWIYKAIFHMFSLKKKKIKKRINL